MGKNGQKNIYAGKRIVIVIHEHARGGPGDALRDFLLPKGISKLLLIGHPLLYMQQGRKRRSRFEYYELGLLKKEFEVPLLKIPDQLLYIKDFYFTLWWILSKRIVSDIFIGVDPLNAFSGIILKRLGLTKFVIYYSIDYFPTRFKNKIMNYIYHGIDKLSVMYADETWNVGSGMIEARKTYNNIKGSLIKKQYTVPIGVWLSKINIKAFSKINKRKLIYAGHLVDYMGVDLAVLGMQEIVKKFPDASFDIIGTGEDERELKKMVNDLHLKKFVRFFGWIENRDIFNYLISNGAIGLAPFNVDILDDKVKNADPGKIKDYMAVGLPVIVTNAISNYKSIQDARSGILIKYSVKDFVRAVSSLFENEDKLEKYRENALLYVKQFDWEVIFHRNFVRVFKKNI